MGRDPSGIFTLMKIHLYFGILLYLFLSSIALQVQAGQETGVPVPLEPNSLAVSGEYLFASDDVLDLKLTVDFAALCRPREVEDCDYTPTTLGYVSSEGAEITVPVELRVRGGWRAQRDHCDVPPLFIRFSSGTQGTPFQGQGMLPLTTHCRSKVTVKTGSKSAADYEQYVLREYLGYRLYNIVTDRSLRVRLVRITYEKPGEVGKGESRYAFFTEHFDELAARDGSHRLPSKSFDHQRVDLKVFDDVALFSFMVGNTDWSVVRQRNILLLQDANERQYPVPYDLDMSGLVDAAYSGVSPRLDFRDPLQRYYLGFCHPELDWSGLFSGFLDYEADMLDVAATVPGFNRTSRKQSTRYLKKFFSIIKSPQRREKAVVSACHGWPPSPEDHTTPPDVATL